jgi:hypothetical protein
VCERDYHSAYDYTDIRPGDQTDWQRSTELRGGRETSVGLNRNRPAALSKTSANFYKGDWYGLPVSPIRFGRISGQPDDRAEKIVRGIALEAKKRGRQMLTVPKLIAEEAAPAQGLAFTVLAP